MNMKRASFSSRSLSSGKGEVLEGFSHFHTIHATINSTNSYVDFRLPQIERLQMEGLPLSVVGEVFPHVKAV